MMMGVIGIKNTDKASRRGKIDRSQVEMAVEGVIGFKAAGFRAVELLGIAQRE